MEREEKLNCIEKSIVEFNSKTIDERLKLINENTMKINDINNSDIKYINIRNELKYNILNKYNMLSHENKIKILYIILEYLGFNEEILNNNINKCKQILDCVLLGLDLNKIILFYSEEKEEQIECLKNIDSEINKIFKIRMVNKREGE